MPIKLLRQSPYAKGIDAQKFTSRLNHLDGRSHDGQVSWIVNP